MCLASVVVRKPNVKTYGIGYKFLHEHKIYDCYRTPFKNSIILKSKWNIVKNDKKISSLNGIWYKSGFHICKTKKAAIYFADGDIDNVYKVQYKNEVARGYENRWSPYFDRRLRILCIVAKSIKVIGKV